MTSAVLSNSPSALFETAERSPLTDRFGRVHNYLRISLTERCNLRCRYCMPAAGVPRVARDRLLSFEEIERVVRVMARLGVNKVRLTGGEPTMRRGLPELVERLAHIEGIGSLGITTNGLRLEELAAPLHSAGLRALNVSLDSLRAERFEQITRRPGLERVLAGIEVARAVGFERIKINVVVIGGVNDDELEAFARWAAREPLEVRFIEFMPFRGNNWREARVVPWREMLTRLMRCWPEMAPTHADGPNAVARTYSAPGFAGSVGFISSMSEHFCAGCNRLRLTAEGSIKSCLFQRAELGLREALRARADDAEIESLIRRALAAKWLEHPPADELLERNGATMTEIGG